MEIKIYSGFLSRILLINRVDETKIGAHLAQTTMGPSADPVSPKSNGLHLDHPFNKIWRGSKDGSIALKPMPKYGDPYAEREWIKVCIDPRKRRVAYMTSA